MYSNKKINKTKPKKTISIYAMSLVRLPKIKRSFNDLLTMFNNDRLTPRILEHNVKASEAATFKNRLRKNPNRYLAGRSDLSKNQLAVLRYIWIEKCKSTECHEFHPHYMIYFCKKCQYQTKLDSFTKTITASSSDDKCPICVSEFDSETQIIQLLCHHQFHKDCIKKWFDQSFKCPCCRTNYQEYMRD